MFRGKTTVFGRVESGMSRRALLKCAKALIAQVCAGGYSLHGFALMPCDDLEE
jgi:hypothetical protein